MFTKAKNIDTAFRQSRRLSVAVIVASAMICTVTIYKSLSLVDRVMERVYILSAGKLMEAVGSDRHNHIAVEMRDHVRNFHTGFFNLSPDERAIQSNISKALYLADGSAKAQYDNLAEQGYYRGIVSGNITQVLNVDSISLNLESAPYGFRLYGTMVITRPTSTVTRSLVTEGRLRETAQSDANPHGFLIERWRVLENNDIDIKKR